MTQPLIVSFVGPPGSGKSTQIEMAVNKLGPGSVVLSVPRLVKSSEAKCYLNSDEAETVTRLSGEIALAKQRGELAPLIMDYILFDVVKRVSESRRYILLDGCPRGLEQVLAF